MKFSHFVHNLFEPAYFFISKFYSKFTYKKNYYNFKKKVLNKNVFIIGAGPSLDNFEISKIKNSIVILINGSYEKYNSFDKSNKIYFTSSDAQRIHEIIPRLPKELDCIVTSSKYRGVIDLIISKNKIIYFHPISSIVLKRFNFLGILKGKIPVFCPDILTLPVKNIEKILSKNIIKNPGRTSLLTILVILMKLFPRSINIIGFDMGKNKNKHYANLKFYQNSKTSWPNKDLKDVKIISQKILFVYSKKNIKFKNYSFFKLDKNK
jgi:hypothetical protein